MLPVTFRYSYTMCIEIKGNIMPALIAPKQTLFFLCVSENWRKYVDDKYKRRKLWLEERVLQRGKVGRIFICGTALGG